MDDPHLWLEEIDGDRVAAWVDAENARTEAALRDSRFQADFDAALSAGIGLRDPALRQVRRTV